MESGSQRSKPRSAGVTVTATTASSVSSCCAKSRGRPFKSQPSLIPQTTVKATGKLKEVQPQKVVIMREMTRYRGVKGDNGSSPAVGLPKKDESALEEVPTRHKKRKRSGLDVDTDFAPTVTAAGRVGRVGRPDSPTW